MKMKDAIRIWLHRSNSDGNSQVEFGSILRFLHQLSDKVHLVASCFLLPIPSHPLSLSVSSFILSLVLLDAHLSI
jgi:hypothetical protein